MKIETQINNYINSQPEIKKGDMKELHQLILNLMPGCRLWFLDGKNNDNKIVSNPNIGYGMYTIKHANGTEKDFYRIGLSANTTGISVYIMGIDDKAYLLQTFGDKIGKATVSGYCIKLKKLADISINILEDAIRFGAELSE